MKCDTKRFFSVMSVFLIMFFYKGTAFEAQAEVIKDLTELSIEELLDVEVTLASRKPQKISQTAAAVFVITNEDIRRSGAASIPELLRIVPGLQVARISSSKWAVTSRGFNNIYANKLLILIDGRTVYSPLFSGVFWDVQDTFLEDVDRIEVIRGPGASLWGANAVNGIINIKTKHTEDTEGGLVYAGFGKEEKMLGGIRFGDKMGKKSYYRIYTKYTDYDGGADVNGDDASNDWNIMQAGFRMDSEFSDKDTVILQGEIYRCETDEILSFPSLSPPYMNSAHDNADKTGGNIMGQWKHSFSNTSDMSLKMIYDRTDREELEFFLEGDILDIDFQHRFEFGERQELVWGMGYRYYHDKLRSSPTMIFNPETEDDHLFSAFIQDDITLAKNRLRLTLGSKFEHNDYTGFEFQPNARLLWSPHEKHSVWAAVSRALKTPSRFETKTQILTRVIPPKNPGQNPTGLFFYGNPDIESEELIALELGYRLKADDRLNFDLAAFYNMYDNEAYSKTGTPFFESTSQSSYMVIPLSQENMVEVETYGLEFLTNWQPLNWWRLQTAISSFEMKVRSKDDLAFFSENESPDYSLSVRSYTDLPWNLEWDLQFRFVDSVLDGNVQSYSAIDTRLGWHPSDNLEISIAGRNLADPQHPEYIVTMYRGKPEEIERSVYVKVTWQF